MTLHIQEDAPVYTADVEKIGSVKRVVIDPLTKQATHIVVRKGVVFSRDRVIPIAAIEKAVEHKITLHRECEADQFPDFEEQPTEADLKQGATGANRMPFDRYGLYGLPFPAVPSVTDEEKERNIPDDSVPLKTGAPVMVGDEKIGVFAEVLSQETGSTTHLVAVLGTLDPKRKAIPMGWVRSVAEESIHLGVPMGMVRQLPDHDPKENLI